LIDEKKALNEISALRRSLKSAAQIDTLESDINSEKEKVEALRKVLDDPEVRSTQVRWDELKKELDGMREEGKKAYEERGALFDRRNELQKKMVGFRSLFHCSLRSERLICWDLRVW
jgi:uncharacterized coiled-coil DUF342 family protein